MVETIYIDMDGVLCDFDGYVLERTGLTPAQYIKSCGYDSAIDDFIKNHPSMFLEMNRTKDFVYGLSMINELVECGYDVCILSSVGEYDSENIILQKSEWLDSNGLIEIPREFVFSSIEKASYANGKTILVDDREKSTIPFETAGGISILHKNFFDTYNELVNILRKDNE